MPGFDRKGGGGKELAYLATEGEEKNKNNDYRRFIPSNETKEMAGVAEMI